MRTVDDLVRDASANARMVTATMAAFGLVTLLLSMIGLYGVISYTARQRSQEFAIRSVLGATRQTLIRLVLADGLMLTLAGLILGTACGVFAGRLLRAMLYHVSPVDPLALLGTVILLSGTASLACVLPALHAADFDLRAALHDG